MLIHFLILILYLYIFYSFLAYVHHRGLNAFR